jgi:hypothetical protein
MVVGVLQSLFVIDAPFVSAHAIKLSLGADCLRDLYSGRISLFSRLAKCTISRVDSRSQSARDGDEPGSRHADLLDRGRE